MKTWLTLGLMIALVAPAGPLRGESDLQDFSSPEPPK